MTLSYPKAGIQYAAALDSITSARAITARQLSNASRPAAVRGSDCGADSRSVMEIGQPSRKPVLAIRPASSLQ
jgi:hypothetical protein